MTHDTTVLPIIAAVALCHMLNDLMQSLIPAIYPLLKSELALSFGQIGLVTFVFQGTASVLQPLVGLYTDKRPLPFSLVSSSGACPQFCDGACRAISMPGLFFGT